MADYQFIDYANCSSILVLVEEVQNISKSIFYRIINYDRQVNLAMKDDETQAGYSASILRNSAIRDGRLLYSILKYRRSSINSSFAPIPTRE